MTTVSVFVAAAEHAGTTGDVMVKLQGIRGVTVEMLFTHGCGGREQLTRVLYHLRNITIMLRTLD
jgi:hypothetical protein